jgi:hypothetical protein
VLGSSIAITLFLAYYNRNEAGQYRRVRSMVIRSIAYGEALLMSIPVVIPANNNPYASFGIKIGFVMFTSIFIVVTVAVPVMATMYSWWSFGPGISRSKHSDKAEESKNTDVVGSNA